MAVAVEVDQAHVGSVEVHGRQCGERLPGEPAALRRSTEVARGRPGERDHVEPAVPGEVEQLRAGRGADGRRRRAGHRLERPEATFAQVGLVPPRVGVGDQHAGDALAVEVGPLVSGRTQPCREVRNAVRVDLAHLGVQQCGRVPELHGWQRANQIAVAVAPVAALGHRGEERAGRTGRRVAEVGRAHEAVLAHPVLGREVVEHQHPTAQPVGPYARSRRGTRRTGRPGTAAAAVAAGVGESGSCSP